MNTNDNKTQNSGRKRKIGTIHNALNPIPDREFIRANRKVGMLKNDQTAGPRQVIPVEKQVVGRINNEKKPYLQRRVLPVEREAGMINNEKAADRGESA